ncbi:MAG: hypothetical protein U9Q40_11885 [Campylobacterota bacterium]|nr:hypothetical protein [Campylobacterota bacterium]
MKKLFFTLLLSAFTLLSELNAEVLRVNSPGDVATNTHLANINALLIFTSQDGLNTGLFHFTDIGVDMEIYNLPLKYHFKSDTKLNYFLVGNLGYSRTFATKDILLPTDSRLNYDNHLRTYTAGLGLGVRYKFTDELRVLGGVEFIYSRSGASVKEPGDDFGDAIEDFFNKNYNDNISYKLLLESVYKPKLETFNPYIKLAYKFYDTKSDFTFDAFSSFKTQSSVLSLSSGFESNELWRYKSSYLTLEAYLNAYYLDGAVEKSVHFNKYAKLGGVAYWYLEDGPLWMERVFLEVSTIKADGLDGYNYGVGFSLKY